MRVSENRMRRKIFGPEREAVSGEWKKLHNEELDGIYCSPNLIWVVKSKGLRRTVHVTRVRRTRGINASRISDGINRKKKPGHLKYKRVDTEIILK
jgi:hypothetical protein